MCHISVFCLWVFWIDLKIEPNYSTEKTFQPRLARIINLTKVIFGAHHQIGSFQNFYGLS